jgi:thiosulfate dehydrogenase (quinone) large subunit
MATQQQIGYALLRVTFGVVFLFSGIEKFRAGLRNFAGGMLQQFSGKLPGVLVQPFAYSLPFVETILGVLIILGLFTTFALSLSGLLLVALTFGTVMLGQFPTVAHNAQYGLVNFVLLWTFAYNRYSLDKVIHGGPSALGEES